MTTILVGDAVDQDVQAGDEGDDLVPASRLFGVEFANLPTIDSADDDDGEVLDMLAPHQSVMEMAMAEILVTVVGVRLRGRAD